MIQRLFRFLGRDVVSIHHAAYILVLSAFLSQLLGLFRDRLLASSFGAGQLLDVYYAAFKVQDFIFYSIASILSLVVLIPLIEGALVNEGVERAKKLLNTLFTVSFVLIAVVSFLAFSFAPELARFLFPGIATGSFSTELVSLMRLLLLSPFIFSFSGLLASVVQIRGRFYITALSPVLYNLGIILGIIFLYPHFGVLGLGYGVLLGAFMHMAIQVPFVVRQGLLPRPTFEVLWGDVRSVLSLSTVRGLALGINQASLIFLTGLATVIATGGVAVMNFAHNMQNIPLALIGGSYSIATFPVLSKFFSKGDTEAFMDQLKSAARHIIFWSFPIMALFIVLRAQIVRVILGSGNFSWEDTRLTAACLALFAVSVVAQSLSLLFVRAYYATGRNKEALYIGIISGLVTVGIAYFGLKAFTAHTYIQFFFEHLLRIEGLEGTAIVILPLAFSIGALVNTTLFMVLFHYHFRSSPLKLQGTVFHSFASSVVMGLVAYQFLDYFGSLFNLSTFVGVFLQGVLSGIFGVTAGAVLLYMLKNREFLELLAAFRRRFTKEEIVAPQEV